MPQFLRRPGGSIQEQRLTRLTPLRTTIYVTLVAMTSLLMTTFTAGPAHAGGDCTENTNDFVFYYEYAWSGAYRDFHQDAVANLSSPTLYRFDCYGDNGDGWKEILKNNSESVNNRKSKACTVYYNSNYAGVYDRMGGRGVMNLDKTSNENASYRCR